MFSVGFTKKTSRKLKKGILLGICYAANIGGTGTLTGSSTNLVLNAIYKEYYLIEHHVVFIVNTNT